MQKSLHTEQQERLLSMLRQLRQDSNVTQDELSKLIGMSQSDISKVERGVRRLDVLELRKWLMCLGTTLPAFSKELESAMEAISVRNRRLHKRTK